MNSDLTKLNESLKLETDFGYVPIQITATHFVKDYVTHIQYSILLKFSFFRHYFNKWTRKKQE